MFFGALGWLFRLELVHVVENIAVKRCKGLMAMLVKELYEVPSSPYHLPQTSGVTTDC